MLMVNLFIFLGGASLVQNTYISLVHNRIVLSIRLLRVALRNIVLGNVIILRLLGLIWVVVRNRIV